MVDKRLPRRPWRGAGLRSWSATGDILGARSLVAGLSFGNDPYGIGWTGGRCGAVRAPVEFLHYHCHPEVRGRWEHRVHRRCTACRSSARRQSCAGDQRTHVGVSALRFPNRPSGRATPRPRRAATDPLGGMVAGPVARGSHRPDEGGPRGLSRSAEDTSKRPAADHRRTAPHPSPSLVAQPRAWDNGRSTRVR